MGVFETLAAVCEPDDLQFIRAGMREFLSVAGSGRKGATRRLNEVVERLFPYEIRYLPKLVEVAPVLRGCRTMTCFAGPGSRLVSLAAAVLQPARVLLLYTPGDEPQTREAAAALDELGFNVGLLPLRGESLSQSGARLFDRLQSSGSNLPVLFYPGDATPEQSVVMAALARRHEIPVVYSEAERYHEIERPFSLTFKVLEVAAPPRKNHRGREISQRLERTDRIDDPQLVAGNDGGREATPPGGAHEPVVGAAELVPPLAKLLIESFNGRNYAAALRLAGHVAKHPDILSLFWTSGEALVDFVRIFTDWDRFRHSPLVDNQRRLLHRRLISNWKKLGAAQGKLVAEKEMAANSHFLRTLQSTWAPGGRLLQDSLRTVDLFAAGLRRSKRARFDEAVVCFERAIERSVVQVMMGEPYLLGDPAAPNYDGLSRIFADDNDIVKRTNHVLARWGVSSVMRPRAAPLNLAQLMALALAAGEIVGDGPAQAIGTRYQQLLCGGPESDEEPLSRVLARGVLRGGSAPLDKEAGVKMEHVARQIVSRALGSESFRKLLAAATHPTIQLPQFPSQPSA